MNDNEYKIAQRFICLQCVMIEARLCDGLSDNCSTQKAIKKLVDKVTPRKPHYRHYEQKGEKPYIKICCDVCDASLCPVTEKNNSIENVYCHKCGVELDWSDYEEEIKKVISDES